MRVLGLDLSTNSGWSVFDAADKLVAYGTIRCKVEGNYESPNYPYNYMAAASKIGLEVGKLIDYFKPNVIVIEETNKGKNRYSQKQLEFIHYNVCMIICNQTPIKYLDTSKWRSLIGLKLSIEELNQKNEFKKTKRARFSDVATQVAPFFDEPMSIDLAAAPHKRAKNKLQRIYKQLIRDVAHEAVARKAVKKDGVRLKPISKKNASVRYVNETLGTKFELKDNDICDSICLCLGYYQLVGDTCDETAQHATNSAHR